MPLVSPVRNSVPWPQGYNTFYEETLAASATGTGGTDYVDLSGYCSKAVIYVKNGITNPVSVKAQGSFDGVDWVDIPFVSVDHAGATLDSAPKITAEQFAASGSGFLFLVPGMWPRYVRANVTAANAAGTLLRIFAEK